LRGQSAKERQIAEDDPALCSGWPLSGVPPVLAGHDDLPGGRRLHRGRVVLGIAGPFQLGVLMCFGLPRAARGPVAGRILDRSDPRLLMAADKDLESANSLAAANYPGARPVARTGQNAD
jgi:hypothetical protein